MSRVVWGSAKQMPSSTGGVQRTLDSMLPRKRNREEGPSSLQARGLLLQQSEPEGLPDDAVCWGPSGGCNRETMGRRRPRPFMNGHERSLVFDEKSPYSREYIAAWRSELLSDGHETPRRETSFDSSLLTPYLAPNCPRDVFKGLDFFLNSCAPDSRASAYILEKLIRYLGGTTSMGGRSVSYVVTQHMCSSKENKVFDKPQGSKSRKLVKYVDPGFILKCAAEGRLVSDLPFRTIRAPSSHIIEL